VFTSDNGPVLDDGYRDQAVEKLGGHRPAGGLRGGKYSAYDAGTRVPFILRWSDRVAKGTSSALVSQIDLVSSLAAMVGEPLSDADAPDSYDMRPALVGTAPTGRDHLVEQAGALSIIVGHWKYIEPHAGERVETGTGIELGNSRKAQLFDLSKDLGERHNLAPQLPDRVRAMARKLQDIRDRHGAVRGQR